MSNNSDIMMVYNFSEKERVRDFDYLCCLRIYLHEPEPTFEGVQRMLTELYAQCLIKPEMLLMNPQDLRDMSIKLVDKGDSNRQGYHFYRYFMGKDEQGMFPQSYGREIKQIGHAGGTTYVYPLESLEHRFVIAGFMPLTIG